MASGVVNNKLKEYKEFQRVDIFARNYRYEHNQGTNQHKQPRAKKKESVGKIYPK